MTTTGYATQIKNTHNFWNCVEKICTIVLPSNVHRHASNRKTRPFSGASEKQYSSLPSKYLRYLGVSVISYWDCWIFGGLRLYRDSEGSWSHGTSFGEAGIKQKFSLRYQLIEQSPRTGIKYTHPSKRDVFAIAPQKLSQSESWSVIPTNATEFLL